MTTKHLYLFIISIPTLFLCNKINDLDVSPKGTSLESNYYKTSEEIFSGVVSVYACTALERDNVNAISKLSILNTLADEAFAGGGNSSDIQELQNLDSLYKLSAASGPQIYIWQTDWKGIYRANVIIDKITNETNTLTEAQKKRYLAELKFLRAYYYFELVRLFKNIPLIINPIAKTEWYQVVQVSSAEIYKQIEADLNAAIIDLPLTTNVAEAGRATQSAAMSLLGKVILFQNNEGRMAEAAMWLEKVASSSLYSLVNKYADLFDVTKKFSTESIWEISFSGTQQSYWGGDKCMGNKYCIMVGPRSIYDKSIYASGWSFNPIRKEFVDVIKTDPRYKVNIINLDSLASKDNATYTQGNKHTGYFVNKYAPLKNNLTTVGGTYELNFSNNIIEIRLADVYLMLAEALLRSNGDISKASTYLNRVRTRVGLPNITVTLENIINERRIELALEGHRWDDLVRTGKASSTLSFKGFKIGVNEILPIPLTELSNTKLTQNAGY